MPEFPNPIPDITKEQALTMILSSIALEEVALSHIINAEGEKIQYILNQAGAEGCSADLNDIVAVNKSVSGLLEIVLQNQMILKNKMESVLEHLPKPPKPPPTPEPPCPPFECGLAKVPVCFVIKPKMYCQNEPLLWKEICGKDRISLATECSPRIQLPQAGTFAADLYLDLGEAKCSSGETQLSITCGDKAPVMQKLLPAPCGGGESLLHKKTTVQIPCACCPCYVSVLVCAPCGMLVRQGQICFTEL